MCVASVKQISFGFTGDPSRKIVFFLARFKDDAFYIECTVHRMYV